MKDGPSTRFELCGGDVVAVCEVTNALVGLLGQAIYWAGPKPMDAGLFEVDVDGRLKMEVLEQETAERIAGEVTVVGGLFYRLGVLTLTATAPTTLEGQLPTFAWSWLKGRYGVRDGLGREWDR